MYFKKLLSAGLLFVSMAIQASDMQLVVELNSNAKYKFLLANQPVVTFDKGNLVVNGEEATSYEITGVKNCHFESEITEAKSVAVNELQIIYVDENTIRVQNAISNAPVSILSVSGVVFSNQNADDSGETVLNLPTQKGVYVITVGDKSFKVVRK